MKSLFAIFFVVFMTFDAQGNLFEQGVRALEQEDYEGARAAFLSFTEQNPLHFEANYNIALIDYRQGKKFLALARARELVQNYPLSIKAHKTLGQLNTELQVTPLSGPGPWPLNLILPFVPVTFLSLVAGLAFGASALTFLRWAKQRREAREDDLEPHPLGPPFYTSALVLVALLVLLAIKLSGESHIKATVLQNSAVHSLPNQKGAELGNIRAGQQVEVLRQQEEWAQVEGGAAMGWTGASNLYIHR